MDLIAASAKEEGGQHVHGWENVSLVEKEAAAATASVVEVENEQMVQSSYFSLPVFRSIKFTLEGMTEKTEEICERTTD